MEKISDEIDICNVKVLLDKEDQEKVLKLHWHINKRDLSVYGLYYFYCRNGKDIITLHRFVMGCKNKDGKIVDHINGNTLDNRKSNLRYCTASESQMNRGIPANNKTGYKGVSYRQDKGKYEGRIKVDGKTIHLGYTETAIESHYRYEDAAKKHYGEFYRESAITEAMALKA